MQARNEKWNELVSGCRKKGNHQGMAFLGVIPFLLPGLLHQNVWLVKLGLEGIDSNFRTVFGSDLLVTVKQPVGGSKPSEQDASSLYPIQGK